MERISSLIGKKGRKVYTVQECSTLEDAILSLSESRAGALIVLEGERPAGIFTKGDLLRCCVRNLEKPFREIKIGEVMTNKLIVGRLEDEIGAAVSTMLQTDISHLPILEGGAIVGMLSFGDLVRHRLESLAEEIDSLHEYISDLQDATRD